MVTVDCKGMTCPQPLINTRNAVRNGANELEVIVDNPMSEENCTRFLIKSGFSVEDTKDADGLIHLKAKRVKDVPVDETTQCTVPGGVSQTLVLITTETLGRGDDELGAALMKNFLSTLPEMQDLWRIVLLNGGVKLSATPGPCLDALKKLAESGVSILVCGTCLNHYGLLEKKQVGEISNMLDIVTSLDLAGKVIRP